MQTTVCGQVMIQYVTNQNEVRASKCVVVVYEDPPIRERAVRFCERLAEERKSAEIDTDWWSFPLLSHPTLAHDAVEKGRRGTRSTAVTPDQTKCFSGAAGQRGVTIFLNKSQRRPQQDDFADRSSPPLSSPKLPRLPQGRLQTIQRNRLAEAGELFVKELS